MVALIKSWIWVLHQTWSATGLWRWGSPSSALSNLPQSSNDFSTIFSNENPAWSVKIVVLKLQNGVLMLQKLWICRIFFINYCGHSRYQWQKVYQSGWNAFQRQILLIICINKQLKIVRSICSNYHFWHKTARCCFNLTVYIQEPQ